jgi:elongation factor G
MSQLERIRNIGVIAHIDAGKTSTSEGMLFFSGRTHRYGNIDDGTTVLDYLEEERMRGITIVAAAATLPWNDHVIHLIDTPGHIDFTAEVERSLRVIDGAVVVFSGVEGVEAQSEKVWRQATHYKVPRIAFINKLDRVGADFSRVVDQVNEKFGSVAVAVQIPMGEEERLAGVIDLLGLEEVRFSGDKNEVVTRAPVSDDWREPAQQARNRLVERLADHDDDLAMLYLEGAEITAAQLRATLRRLTLANTLVPVLCGSAKRALGVQLLLDAVIDYLPSPADIPEIPAFLLKDGQPTVVHPDPKAPLSALVFKVIADKNADLLYVRTYSGTLKVGATLINPRTGEKLRAKQLLKVYAKSTEPVDEVGPGDIVGILGMKGCGTGDTLCEPFKPVYFEKITFPEPVISVALEPRFTRDKDKLDEALELLCREDPTLSRSVHEETGQRILSGMGELHLEIKLKRLNTDFNVETRAGEPRVAYRETFRGSSLQHVVFSRTFGDTELFAECQVSFRPLPSGEEFFRIENKMRNKNNLPRALVAAAEKALGDGLRTGGAYGYPMIFAAAELQELVIDPQRTTEGAVVGAVLQAVNQAIVQAGTTLLEPLMRLEVTLPENCIGELSGYLQSRRALIGEMEMVGPGLKKIGCTVPLAEMFGFGKSLPRLTGGRGSFSMEPCGYQEIDAQTKAQKFGLMN